MKSQFVRDPLPLFEEDAKTARYDLQRDILAVSMLGVSIPAGLSDSWSTS